MAELSRFLFDWWPRFALAGGALLLIGWLVVSLCRQPAKRVSAGFWTLVIALGLVPLTLLPGWLALPWQSPFAASDRPIVEHESQRTVAAATVTRDQDESALEDATQPGEERFQVTPDRSDVGWVGSSPVPSNNGSPEPAVGPSPDSSRLVVANVSPKPEQSWRVGLAEIALAVYGIAVICLLTRLLVGQIGLIRLWKSGRRPWLKSTSFSPE